MMAGLTLFQKKVLSIGFLLFVACVLLTNAFITMWIITAIGFNSDLAINLKGSHVEAKANIFALESLFASKIASYNGKGLYMQSFKNITLSAISSFKQSAFVLGEEGVTLFTNKFEIKDRDNNPIISNFGEKTTIGSKKLEILGDGGHSFKSGIETQMIRAGPGNSLGLVSPVGRLNIEGPKKIGFRSFAGPISFQALDQIHLRARRGNITFDSSVIRIPSLGNYTEHAQGSVSERGKMRGNVPKHGSAIPQVKRRNSKFITHQLCACQDGKLFAAKSTSHCVANYQICPD